MFDEIIDGLTADMHEANEQARTIQAKADGEKRVLTEDEDKEIARLTAVFDQKADEIERRTRVEAQNKRLAATAGRKAEPQAVATQETARPQSNRAAATRIEVMEDRGKWGWRHFGDFAAAVRSGSSKTGTIDPRLVANAPTTYNSEGVGEDGGFLVPPDFRAEIMQKINGVDSLFSRTDQQVCSGNSMTFNKDENAPWASTGIQVYWGSEAGLMSQSKAVLEQETMRLNKLYCLVPVTEEQLADGPSLAAYLGKKVPQKFDYKIQNALIAGSGVGQMQGILSAGCTVSVAKDTVSSPIQAADTFTYRNVVDMWNRMYAPCRKNAVWLINQDIEPHLDLMRFDNNRSSTQPVPVYLPSGGASDSPYATLKGRPVIPVESCSAIGDEGDVILADLSQYMTLIKTGGLRQDVSIHLWFDYDVSAFRFVFRIHGQPWWREAITLPNSTGTRSCFVTLAAR